jgi:phosphoribosyl 1,2-cyclic phosphate phosphodiesterase
MSQTMTFRILGCGPSPGVPRIGNDWGACDPAEPRNRRRRAAMLVTRSDGNGGLTRLLVDVGADLREQMLDARVPWVDAVVITHPHADHIHGIDDLRSFYLNRHRMIDVHMDEATARRVHEAFGYCFASPPGSSYPPILVDRRITVGTEVVIEGEGGPIAFTPFRQLHGDIESLGLRFDRVAYSTDASDFPEESLPFVVGLDHWIVGALRRRPHPSHFSVDQALAWIDRMKPKHALLTHLYNALDYRTLLAELPEGVEPAWDGLEFEITVTDR